MHSSVNDHCVPFPECLVMHAVEIRNAVSLQTGIAFSLAMLCYPNPLRQSYHSAPSPGKWLTQDSLGNIRYLLHLWSKVYNQPKLGGPRCRHVHIPTLPVYSDAHPLPTGLENYALNMLHK